MNALSVSCHQKIVSSHVACMCSVGNYYSLNLTITRSCIHRCMRENSLCPICRRRITNDDYLTIPMESSLSAKNMAG